LQVLVRIEAGALVVTHRWQGDAARPGVHAPGGSPSAKPKRLR
jgi:hypothetical protein